MRILLADLGQALPVVNRGRCCLMLKEKAPGAHSLATSRV